MSFLSNLFGNNNRVDLNDIIRQGAFLVDVREKSEFSGGSAKGAVNIPLGSIQSQLQQFKGKQNIIVFCRSGARSGQAKSILETNGISHVINGGSWQNVAQIVG